MLRMCSRLLAITVVSSLSLAAGIAPARAAGGTTCSVSGTALTVTVGSDDTVVIVASSGEIVVNSSSVPVACSGGTPTVSTIDSGGIVYSSGATQDVTVGLTGGSFPGQVDESPGSTSEIEWALSAGESGDVFHVQGASTNNTFYLSDTGLNLNGDDDEDVTWSGFTPSFVLRGGAGFDLISAMGPDCISTGASFPVVVYGGGWGDTLCGGDDADEMHGEDGPDFINGGLDADDLYGEADYDTFSMGTSADGADLVHGGEGLDTAEYGGRTNNILVDFDNSADDGEASEGDTLFDDVERAGGGDGDDTFTASPAENRFDGGGGSNTLDYSNATGSVTVDLQLDLGQDPTSDDVISNISNVIGSAFDDTMIGWDVGNLSFDGGPGIDEIGSRGSSNLYFNLADGYVGVGTSVWILNEIEDARGSLGDDTFVVGAGPNAIHGGPGTDTVDYTLSFDAVTVTEDEVANDGPPGEGDNIGVDVEGIMGTAENDTLVGSALANTLEGMGGDDTLVGRGGNDTLRGSFGNDVLWGGNGDDDLQGWYGDDTVNGDAGNDVLTGAFGNDTMNGGDGDDVVSGEDGNDSLSGGLGEDDVLGGAGNDTLNDGSAASGSDVLAGGSGTDTITYTSRTAGVSLSQDGVANDGAPGEGDSVASDVEKLIGGSGNDSLSGDAAANQLFGLGGNDTLRGKAGNDLLDGGIGNDTFVAESVLDGTDDMIGSSGVDTASYISRTGNLAINLSSAGGDGLTGENDHVRSDIENVTGGSGADVITGSAAANTLIGASGNDTLNGADANDVLYGGSGTDVLNAGNGNDVFREDSASNGNDTFNGGAGIDQVEYRYRTAALVVDIDGAADDGAANEKDNVRTDVERVVGGSGADRITGSSAVNVIWGGSGNDILTGGGGADLIYGDAGNDTFYLRDGVKDTAVGGVGTDRASRDAADAVSLIESFF